MYYSRFFTKQHDKADCGPACLSMIVKFYGGYESITNIRLESGTSKTGTSLLGLYRAAKNIGFDAKGYECEFENLKTLKTPIIAHVIIENLEHFIVIYKYDLKNDKFIIADPSNKVRKILSVELRNIYKTGHILVLEPNDNFKKKDIHKTKLRFLKEIIKPDKSIIISNLIFGIIVSVLGLSLSVIIQKIIDSYLPSKDFSKILSIIYVLSIFLLFRIFFGTYRNLLSIKQTNAFNIRLINIFYSKLLKLKLPFFESKNIGDLTARLDDTQRINKLIIFILEKFILDILIIIFSLIIILYYSKDLFLLSALSIPLFLTVFILFNNKISNKTTNIMVGHSVVNSNYINTIKSIELVKSERLVDNLIGQNQKIYTNYQNSILNLGKLKLGYSILIELLNSAFILGVILLGVFKVFNGTLNIGEFFAIFSIANLLMPVIQDCISIISPFNEAKVAFERMFEYSFSETENTDKGISFNEKIESVDINHLSFAYPNQISGLNEINMSINIGKIYGVIGETGSGKTTLRKLLEKFYDYDRGEIIINKKVSLNDISINDWRSKLGVVHQDIHIFNGTLLDNISLGKFDNNSVKRFCDEFGFAEYFEKFPNGYFTLIGENGINLSGGQKQLISIARCLINNYQIIILDEATSAIDRKTENFIFKLLQKFKEEKVILFITHKFNILPRIADKIYLIENGNIASYGSHEELIEKSNFYSEYFLENVIN